MCQEAEKLDKRSAFRATLTNFVAHLLITQSFVMIELLAYPYGGIVALVWGSLLLTGLSYARSFHQFAGYLL